MIFIWEQPSTAIIHSKLWEYSRRWRPGEYVKDKNEEAWGCKGGSVGKNIGSAYQRGLGFSFQHPHESLQLSLTPIQGNLSV